MSERYQFVKHLTQGGQGSICLYEDTQNNNVQVVLKTCVDMTENNQKRFFREAETMKLLKHPHLVDYIDFLQNPSRIVMEYLPGGNLAEKIAKEGKLFWRDAVAITLQVLEGLRALHEKNIIHRDIKPANILFTSIGTIKLGDFGVVKSNTIFMEQLTVPEAVIKPGTILYAPPEFFSPDSGCDQRSDIYSLGVTLYEMITGKQPFVQNNDSSLNCIASMIAIINGNYLPVGHYVADLPDGVGTVLKKMMSVQMEDRYSSLMPLKQAIEALISESVMATTNSDPLALLCKDVGGHETLWAREEFAEIPAPEQLKYFYEIKTSLAFMPEWRKNMALPNLLRFALKYGKWKDACEISAELYRADEPRHQHLLAVSRRIENGGGFRKDWYFEVREKVRSRVWPEKTFQCQKCQKSFDENDVKQNRVFFMPEIYCQGCLLHSGVDFVGYKLSQVPVAKDTLGTYYLAISQNQQPYLIHKVPWERGKIPMRAAQNIIERYKRGILLAAKLKGSPWVLSINNPYPLEDRYNTYFFLDYRPSRKLVHFSRKQTHSFSLSKAYILAEILRGLEMLKATGAIHRYISPQQINIDFQGDVWLSGFSLAKFDDHSSDDWVELTMDLSGVRIGNPYYMAPEAFKGMKYADHRSDLWSFGALAYQILTGESLFKETKADILQVRRSKVAYTPICDVADNTPVKFARLIDKCLEEAPDKRYHDAGTLLGEMAREITDFYQFIKTQKK